LWGKHTLLDQALHIPLILRGPAIPSGQKLSGVSSDVDLLPTLCTILGLDVPEQCQGRSIEPCLHDDGHAPRHPAFSRFNTTDGSGNVVEGASVRSDRYRVTRWKKPVDGSMTVELYDFETDWHERRNHAYDPEYRPVVEAHLTLLNEVNQTTGHRF
jgi:iduronate 2-sulfatase